MTDYTISIIGEQESPEEERETFELITDGKFTRRGGVAKISYEDSDVTGSDGFFETTFLVEPERVTLTRGSWFGADMVFDEAQKHHILYQTPAGAFAMGVQTESIKRELNDKGGCLYIKYTLDVDNIIVSKHSFKISVSPFKNAAETAKPVKPLKAVPKRVKKKETQEND